MKRHQLLIISAIILSLVIISTLISFYLLFNESNSNYNCSRNICIEYDVDPCQGEGPLDTKIFIVNRFIKFLQNITSYCSPPLSDSNNFKIELLINSSVLTVREILTVDDYVSRCICLFGVNGKISGLLPGNYNLVFIFDNRYVMQTHVLKEFEICIQ